MIDEVLVAFMPAPHTYTRQDCLEIQAHGSRWALNEILELAIRSGARPADPGEFTLRAFLNGRIDLTQAEAVSEIINTESKENLLNAQKQLQGDIKEKIDIIREQILEVLVEIETGIDFVQENLVGTDIKCRIEDLRRIIENTDRLIGSYEKGRILKDGITILILGRPNAGKSTLMNAIMGFERCIVTDIEGTTRDLIEDRIQWKGISINVVDTIGIRKTDDPIEAIGQKILEKKLDEADLILWVEDVTKKCFEKNLFSIQFQKKPYIRVLNKMDIFEGDIDNRAAKGETDILCISAKEKTGIEDLLNRIVKRAFIDTEEENEDCSVITNVRQVYCLKNCKENLAQAINLINRHGYEELIAEELRLAINHIDLITGKKIDEEILDMIFSEFCIGK